MTEIKFECDFAKCVTSGAGFVEGVIYPVLGDNNGIHIMRKEWRNATNDPGGDSADPHDFVAFTGGIGKGIFNNPDNSGKPSFDPWPFL